MNTAQISTDGTHQIVILPEGFKMSGTEVYIKKGWGCDRSDFQR